MKESEDENSDSVRRRNVLKGIGVAGSVGSLPSVAATEGRAQANRTQIDSETKRELQQMAKEYSSVENVRTAFAEIGAPLLRTLDQEGFIDDASVESLPIRKVITPKQHTLGEEDGVMVVGVTTPKGPTARLQVVKRTERFTNVLTIDVHTGETRALVRDRKSPAEAPKVVDPDGSQEVGTMCTAGSYCRLTVGIGGDYPCQRIDVECCLSQEFCRDIGELGAECTEGTCYDHCLFACGICEDGSC